MTHQIEDALFGWGDWARDDAGLGYPKVSTIHRFRVDGGQSGVGLRINGDHYPLAEKVDSAVGRLSRVHPLEGEIVKLTYVHKMNAGRVGSALKIGRGQVRERLKYSHGWLEVFVFPEQFFSEDEPLKSVDSVNETT